MEHMDRIIRAHGADDAQDEGLMPSGSVPKALDIAIKRLEPVKTRENRGGYGRRAGGFDGREESGGPAAARIRMMAACMTIEGFLIYICDLRFTSRLRIGSAVASAKRGIQSLLEHRRQTL